MLVRRVFSERTCVLTSATLELGGSFDAVAEDDRPARRRRLPPARHRRGDFDYQRQAIVYVARDLPAPGRDGTSRRCSTRSRRWSAPPAAGRWGCSPRRGRPRARRSSCRARSRRTRLRSRSCQGEDQISTLVRQFAREPATCLFGTLTLWQGVDAGFVVPARRHRPDPVAGRPGVRPLGGDRPDGWNGSWPCPPARPCVARVGRLVRRSGDRGVVAILDSRMVNARYASFSSVRCPLLAHDGPRARASRR